MKRYYFQLIDQDYNDLSAFIPDGNNKETAVNHAIKWMKTNRMTKANLSVNSMATNNLLDVIEIEL